MKNHNAISSLIHITIANLKLFVGYIFILLLLWVIGIISPYISGLYIDALVQGISLESCISLIAIIAISSTSRIALQYFRAITSTKLGQQMVHQTSDEIFQKIFRSKYSNYCNIDSAYYIDQINRDSNTVINFLISNIFNFFLQAATIIASAAIVFRADKFLCAIILLLIPFYIATFLINKDKMHTAKADVKSSLNQYGSSCAEQINKISYIKRNTLHQEMHNRLSMSFDRLLSASIHSVSIDYLFANLNQVVIVIAYLCIIVIGGYKVSIGMMSIGLFSVINTYFNMIISSVSYFVGMAGNYQDTKVSFQRIEHILETPEEKIGDRILDNINTVKVEDLSLLYGSKAILNHCSFTFTRGHLYGICGQNGVGKTTLLNAIVGLFTGDHTGTVLYNEVDICQLDLPALRRNNITYLEQDPVILNMSVEEYLCFGINASDNLASRQKELLKAFNVGYLLNKELNENGSNLSGGEKQKLAIVRGLSKESSLILLDEPTASLDKSSSEILLDLLQRIKANAIILVVSHDKNVLERCDETIELVS